jgi:hypothetical protein
MAFQEFKWRGVVFHYVTTSGNSVGSTNTSLGTVMMSTNYDAAHLSPTGKVELLNEYYSNDSVPSQSFAHPIECDPSKAPVSTMYVTPSPNTVLADRRMEDLGYFYIHTQGMPAAGTVLGELWVTYEVDLIKPRADAALGYAIPAACLSRAGAVTNAAWAGSIVSASAFAPTAENDFTITATTANQLTFTSMPPGLYKLTLQYNNPTAVTWPTVAIGGGDLVLGFAPDSAQSSTAEMTAITAGACVSNTYLFKKNTPATTALTWTATGGTGVLTGANALFIYCSMVANNGTFA